jgi:hypothetical protein
MSRQASRRSDRAKPQDLVFEAALAAVTCSVALDAGNLACATTQLGTLREALRSLECHGPVRGKQVDLLRAHELRLTIRLFAVPAASLVLSAGIRRGDC